jgi:hypothetical protein
LPEELTQDVWRNIPKYYSTIVSIIAASTIIQVRRRPWFI